MTEAVFVQSNIYLGLALFCLGILGFLWKRDAISMFVCVELMLNAANLVFLSFAREFDDLHGSFLVLAVITVAAAEAGVGLAIFISVYRTHGHLRVDDLNELKQ
jgi:NADH-quinone oxidoreductase subunit K